VLCLVVFFFLGFWFVGSVLGRGIWCFFVLLVFGGFWFFCGFFFCFVLFVRNY